MDGDVMDHGETALSTVARDTGVMALAVMSETDFEHRLAALKLGKERVRRIQREMMTEDEDYGVIPGTKKPTLLKPGAETICQAYGLVPAFERTWIYGDGIVTPHLRVEMVCSLHRGSKDGPIIGEGVGAANSWERKHRYRAAQRACPDCGVEGSIRRSTFEREGDRGYYCHGKAGGCGAQFLSTDTRITEQQGGQVDNPDPYDVENTLLKMAAKRAQVDAVLRATATSGLFAQDLEDSDPAAGSGGEERSREQAQASTSAPRTQAARPAQQQSQPAAKASAGGVLPKWTGPCPNCEKTGAVIVSKRTPGMYHCWKGASRVAGCGADFAAPTAAEPSEPVEGQE